MTRGSDRTPLPTQTSGSGRSQSPKPGRSPGNSEVFGRFVGTLARLEGGAGQAAKGREGGR